jgi:hypothetical protein
VQRGRAEGGRPTCRHAQKTYEGRDGLGGTELMGTTQGNYGVTREVPAHCCGYSVQEKHNNFHIVADKKR